MGAIDLFYVKFIATEAPTFFGYIISVLAIVHSILYWNWSYADISSLPQVQEFPLKKI